MEEMFLGPAPPCEDCVQVGTKNYQKRAIAECLRYKDLLREVFGNEPEGARLKLKRNPHDFGDYFELICEFDQNNKEAIEYASKCEDEGPSTWKG